MDSMTGEKRTLGVQICEALGLRADLVTKIDIEVDVEGGRVYVKAWGSPELIHLDWSEAEIDIEGTASLDEA